MITIETLKRMSPEQRAQLYKNARKRLDKGGQEIIWSADGKQTMVEATDAGLPALSGVEPIIVKELGGSVSRARFGHRQRWFDRCRGYAIFGLRDR
ncbi:hypothetical protein HPQ64_04310 [Rhizobiales bacterium]|uniref:hypothetical protein n=1 Tax=Hongsoonwoonella zoysiae TaxID=2821844 RepID=UPI00156093B0|nr:hypothetical protein [Hongsoonwoonella zoysiae]NRG16910.1 hypothetical protein [Hongsoonwoonella zoysiae]